MICDLRIDAARGTIGWRSGEQAHEARIGGAVAARAGTDGLQLVVLVREKGESGLIVLSADGRERAQVSAPAGYVLSHFEGEAVVGQGDESVDGWRDWYFEIDVEKRRLQRMGPAY